MDVVREKQAGFVLWEVMLLSVLLLFFATQALPGMFKLYRQMAVEYEAERFLSEIRRCQVLSRVTAESAWGYGAEEAGRKYVRLNMYEGGNTISAGGRYILDRSTYLPGVCIVKITEKKELVPFEGRMEIAFISNGVPKVADGMMTILIFFRGYPQEGRKIMISMGGRIRMGRGTDERR